MKQKPQVPAEDPTDDSTDKSSEDSDKSEKSEVDQETPANKIPFTSSDCSMCVIHLFLIAN